MKMRMRKLQKRYRVASWGRIVCSLFFVSGACPELLPKGIKTKEKHTVVEPFNLRIYFENFTNWNIDKGLMKNLTKIINYTF